MLAIHVENLSGLTVIECKGRIVTSGAVFKLRDIVRAQVTARIIVLDLSEVKAIGGGGLGMLAFLENWTRQHHIQFKLYDPSPAVIEGLVRNRSTLNFEIAGFHEMMGILMRCERGQRLAA
jgi:anti-anti-sigma regulatory factor